MLTLDPDCPRPPFEQLRDQVAAQVRSGELAAGTRLPAVRRLAADLEIAAGTVARAYRELEQAGLVVTSRRTGTTVAPGRTAVRGGSRAAERTREYVNAMRALGLADAAILDAVREALTRST